MNRLTLKEIASLYRRTPKTFKKYVIELGIPHVTLGRDMLFDQAKVERFLEGKTFTPKQEIELPRKKYNRSDRTPSSKFEGILG